MKRWFVFGALLAATLYLAPVSWAKTFYLKNGEQLEYQRYWQKGGRVFVLINRDTLVDFAPGEVALAKTAKAAKAVEKAKHKKAKHGRQQGMKAKAHQAGEKKLSCPSSAGMSHANPRATVPDELRNELAAVYGKYNSAALAGDFAEVEKYMTARHRAETHRELAKVQGHRQELAKRRQALQETAVKDAAPTWAMVSADGTQATLLLFGKKASQGTERESVGKVDFEREADGWKVKVDEWSLK